MTIEEIIAQKDELIAIKKSANKYSDLVTTVPLKDEDVNVTKLQLDPSNNDSLVKVIANTYYWLDSHGDVHVKGCFTKSIKENVGKIFHFDNHNHSFNAKVGNVKNIIEKKVNWSDLGIQKDGFTYCLIGETELKEDYNRQVFDAYKSGEINQHSVGMQYVNIQLAINNPTEVEAYKLWNEVYPLLGNPERADQNGYFWVVKEAKLKEYSSVLWNGSNDITPTIDSKEENEPSEDTQKINEEEPLKEDTPIEDEKKGIFNPNLF